MYKPTIDKLLAAKRLFDQAEIVDEDRVIGLPVARLDEMLAGLDLTAEQIHAFRIRFAFEIAEATAGSGLLFIGNLHRGVKHMKARAKAPASRASLTKSDKG